MKAMKKKLVLVGGAVAAGVASAGAFAQASGTAPFNDATLLSSIGGVGPIIQDVGGAVIGILVIVWSFKLAMRFIGR